MFLSAVLDHRGVTCGPKLCPEQTRGQRTFCYTTLQIRESGIVSLCRETRAACRGGRVCGTESSHALATKHCVCWGDVDLPRNTVCNVAFLSIVLTGTRNGDVLLIISSALSRPVSARFVLLHSTIARAGTVEPQSSPQFEVCPRGLQVQGQTEGPRNIELLCPTFA